MLQQKNVLSQEITSFGHGILTNIQNSLKIKKKTLLFFYGNNWSTIFLGNFFGFLLFSCLCFWKIYYGWLFRQLFPWKIVESLFLRKFCGDTQTIFLILPLLMLWDCLGWRGWWCISSRKQQSSQGCYCPANRHDEILRCLLHRKKAANVYPTDNRF